METFFNNIVSSIGITDVLDILIVAFIVYKVLGFIRETRAEQLAKGLVILVIITLLSRLLHLYTLNWILSGVMTVGLVALVVIFQPELRRALEHLGRSRFVNVLDGVDKEEAKRMVLEMVEAIDNMSSSRTGALIVIEGEITLNDIVETGTTLKETGLTVLEEVCPLSARVVVNQVSMKMDNERITKLISDLKTVIK